MQIKKNMYRKRLNKYKTNNNFDNNLIIRLYECTIQIIQ